VFEGWAITKLKGLFMNFTKYISQSIATVILLHIIIRTMNTTFNQYRKACYQERIHQNNLEVVKDATKRSKPFLKKIESFRQEKLTDIEREVMTVDVICQRIIAGDPLVCALFRKDPTKQSLDEVCQIQWLKKNLSPTTDKLPADKVGAKFFINQTLSTITETNKRPKHASKTLDTYDPVNNTYGILKYTSVSGGAQDNQFADVEHFMREIVGYLQKTSDAPETFVFYLDGSYYTEEKIHCLKELIPEGFDGRIRITNCEAILPRPSESDC